MTKVTVIDSIMGSGKTTWAKEYMNLHQDSMKFIYVSPYLDEIQNNILKACPFLIEPDSKLGKGSKLKHFKELLVNGSSIITTHALFRMLDEEVMDLLQNAGYTLIMDEVANVIEKLDEITKDDIQALKDAKLIEVEGRKVKWLDNGYKGVYGSSYVNVKYHSQQGNIYIHNNMMLFWTYPVKIFDLFENSYILTYLFDGQIQKYYYELFNVKTNYKSVEKIDDCYILVPHNPKLEDRKRYKELISIYEGAFNSNYVYQGKVKGHELSSTWIKNSSNEMLERLQLNLTSFFKSKGKSKDNLWTTKLSIQSKLRGKGYTKGFIPWTTRATNDHQETYNLAFVYNLYMNPFEKAFFEEAGVKVDEDLLAVSNLLQWIWRSRIRKLEPESINVYIPSLRMRTLLKQWLDNKEIRFHYKNRGY
ncbi:DEAD/DEAH box helicase family protein [Planococcus maritimus]|nr:DEAD/DEAH box helicase family protein [Planococcus sp. SK3692]MDE4086438.1 DEAD/DEAH box helicase family protein [Planococcus maritimus]